MSAPPVVVLPQRMVVSVVKVRRLAKFLRARRQGRTGHVPWERLSKSDQDWWLREALEHLVAADIVVVREQEVPLNLSAGEAAGIIAPRDGAVREMCQT